jgi:hypothetical protein
MVGLPLETDPDIEGIIALCKRIKHEFLKSSRARKRIGEITVSLNCFVPKPFTPFQWVAMEDVNTLKMKIKKIKAELKKVANLRIHADVPKWAYIQSLLSRGDRRVADILSLAHIANEISQNSFPGILLTTDFKNHFSGKSINAPKRSSVPGCVLRVAGCGLRFSSLAIRSPLIVLDVVLVLVLGKQKLMKYYSSHCRVR